MNPLPATPPLPRAARPLQVVGLVALALSLLLAALGLVAHEAAAAVAATVTPNTGLHDGDTVAVHATGLTADQGSIQILECAGTVANPPTDNTACDATTLDTSAGTDGSGVYDNAAFSVHVLPDPDLGTSTITCDNSHACVLYIGEDQNNFSAKHAFADITFASGENATTTTTTSTSTTSTSSTSTTSTSSTTSTTSTSTTSTTSTTLAGGNQLTNQSCATTTTAAPTTTTSPSTTTTTVAGQTTTTSSSTTSTTVAPTTSTTAACNSGSSTTSTTTGAVLGETLSASSSGDSLPFTGGPAVPGLFLGGVAALLLGSAGRRRALSA